MTNPSNEAEVLEQWLLTGEPSHTMKLVPEGQRELFAYEMAKHVAQKRKEARLDELRLARDRWGDGRYQHDSDHIIALDDRIAELNTSGDSGNA